MFLKSSATFVMSLNDIVSLIMTAGPVRHSQSVDSCRRSVLTFQWVLIAVCEFVPFSQRTAMSQTDHSFVSSIPPLVISYVASASGMFGES